MIKFLLAIKIYSFAAKFLLCWNILLTALLKDLEKG